MDTSPTLSRSIGKTLWQGYSPDMPDDAIRTAFMVKYGYPPKETLRGPSIVLVGPVLESEPASAPERLESAV